MLPESDLSAQYVWEFWIDLCIMYCDVHNLYIFYVLMIHFVNILLIFIKYEYGAVEIFCS